MVRAGRAARAERVEEGLGPGPRQPLQPGPPPGTAPGGPLPGLAAGGGTGPPLPVGPVAAIVESYKYLFNHKVQDRD